jgi:hypothetical protein
VSAGRVEHEHSLLREMILVSDPQLCKVLATGLTSDEQPMNEPPGHIKLMLHTPLYEEYSISGQDAESVVWNLEYFNGKLDCYCIECQRDSVFSRGPFQLPHAPPMPYQQGRQLGTNIPMVPVQNFAEAKTRLAPGFFVKPRDFSLDLQCSRNGSHTLRFFFRVHNKCLLKIGQFPSIADLSLHELRPYSKILGQDKYRELTRAVGLVAHGVGIGAFVYLRRIFEELIEQARQEALRGGQWADEDFEKKRMIEKIESLKGFLPPFLVENKPIYGILSLGIHELSEQDCLEYFEPVKLSILMILDQKLEEQERKKRESEVKQAISKISSKVGQTDSLNKPTA